VPHPKLDNLTQLAFEAAFLADEGGRSVFVPIVKAAYIIDNGPRLTLMDEQAPVNLSGEHWAAPETSSYKYEPKSLSSNRNRYCSNRPCPCPKTGDNGAAGWCQRRAGKENRPGGWGPLSGKTFRCHFRQPAGAIREDPFAI